MDGLSATASIITVVSLALSSVRVISNTLHDIKHGLKAVEQLDAGLQDLSRLLQQLRLLLETNDPFYLRSNLQGLVDKCVRDLAGTEKFLSKLFLSGGKKISRPWRKIKAAIHEKHLYKISAILQRHVGVLTLQIGIIEGKRGSSHTGSLDRVEARFNSQMTLHTANTNILQEMGKDIKQTHGHLQGLETTSISSNQNTRLTLEGLGSKVQDLSNLSMGQSETLNAILELVQQQFPARGRQSTTDTKALLPTEAADEMASESKAEDDAIQDALQRLCHLAREKEKTVFSDEAEKIISDIEQVFAGLFKSREADSLEDRKGKRRWSGITDDVDEDLSCQKEIKRIKGFLDTSQRVSINDKASSLRSLALGKIRSKNKRHQRRLREGTITIRTRRNHPFFAPVSENALQDSKDDGPLEILETSVAFQSNGAQATRIAVAFQQIVQRTGSLLKNPILTVSNLLPGDSQVFQIIANSNLNDLIKSLSLRESFLTDRDLQGRCLLHYALYFHQLDIIKFLIEAGADVNFVEQDFDGNESEQTPALRVIGDNDFENDDE